MEPHDLMNTPLLLNLATRALPTPSATKMLPAESRATSVGRLKTSLSCSRKASTAAATALSADTRTCARLATRNRNRNGFWFPAQQQLRVSRRIKVLNKVRHLIDDPDVVLWID